MLQLLNQLNTKGWRRLVIATDTWDYRFREGVYRVVLASMVLSRAWYH